MNDQTRQISNRSEADDGHGEHEARRAKRLERQQRGRRPPFVGDQGPERDCGDDQQRECGQRQPVPFVGLRERDEQRQKSDRCESPTDDVESWARRLDVVTQPQHRADQRDDAHWDIDPERPAPTHDGQQIATDEWTEGGRDHRHRAPQPHDPASALRRIGVRDDRQTDRHQRSSGESLHRARSNEHGERPRHTTDERRAGEHGETADHRSSAAEAIDHPRRARLCEPEADEIRGHHPVRVVAREVLDDRRECEIDDSGVERDQQRRENDDDQRQPGIAADLYRVTGLEHRMSIADDPHGPMFRILGAPVPRASMGTAV